MKQELLARARAILIKCGMTSDSILSGTKNSTSASDFIVEQLCEKLESKVDEASLRERYDKEIRSDKEVREQSRRS